VAHSIANRLRKLAGNRRQVRRRKARRRAQLVVPTAAIVGKNTTQSIFEGYTRDISAGGIALVIPALKSCDGDNLREGGSVEIALELPAITIRMRATPVRCEVLEGSDRGCLIAARIVELNDVDRARLADYLRRLSSSVSDFAPLL
jgi:hypothetical protein